MERNRRDKQRRSNHCHVCYKVTIHKGMKWRTSEKCSCQMLQYLIIAAKGTSSVKITKFLLCRTTELTPTMRHAKKWYRPQ